VETARPTAAAAARRRVRHHRGRAGGGAPAATAEEEKTEFNVVLKSFGDNKINVIKLSARSSAASA